MAGRDNIINKLDNKEKGCDYSVYRVSRFIQPSLLLFLSKSSFCGYGLIDRLKILGFHKEAIDIGAVYRTLRKLEKEGFVKSNWAKEGGRRKRIYKITPRGRSFLKVWIARIEERKKALEAFIRLYQGGDL